MIGMVILPNQILVKALVGASIAAIALSLIGTLIVQLKITNVGYSMSHAAFAGAAFGIWLDAYFFPGMDEKSMAILFTLFTAVLLGPLSDKTNLSSEVILGALFSLLTALGFIFLSSLPSGVITQQAVSIMWGSIFGLRYIDFLYLGLIVVGLVVIILLFYREFVAIIFHEKAAAAAGIRVSLFKFIILLVTALVVSISMKIVGALLVYAMIITPSSAVYQFVYDFKKLLIFSPFVGLASAILGMLLSLATNFPISSSMILISCVFFLFSAAISPKRRTRNKMRNSKDNEPNFTSREPCRE
ncbi:MAG: metal ABC transporter permease [Promethearchaeota archaeon]